MLSLLTLPDPRLFQTSEEQTVFDDEFRNVVEEMFQTMHASEGVGLAAIQVGIPRRFFVLEVPKVGRKAFINPKITAFSERQSAFEEGCLSIPGIFADVTRPLSIRIEAQDVYGEPFTVEADDFYARVIQHEFDHLDGVLFYSHLKERQQKRFLNVYSKSRGIEIPDDLVVLKNVGAKNL